MSDNDCQVCGVWICFDCGETSTPRALRLLVSCPQCGSRLGGQVPRQHRPGTHIAKLHSVQASARTPCGWCAIWDCPSCGPRRGARVHCTRCPHCRSTAGQLRPAYHNPNSLMGREHAQWTA